MILMSTHLLRHQKRASPRAARAKPPDEGTPSPRTAEAFSKELVQRAGHTPSFRGFARGNLNLLRHVPLAALQAVASAVHQPNWLVAKADIPTLDQEALLGALDQYLRHHRDGDHAWDAEAASEMEEDQMEATPETQRNPESRKGAPYYSFGCWAAEVNAGMQLAKEAFHRQLQMLHLLAEGHEPSAADINSLTQLAAGALGTLNGLAGGCDLMLDLYKECRASAVPFHAAAAHPDAQPASSATSVATGPSRAQRPLSYRDAVARASVQAARPQMDPHRAELLRKRREVFGDLKKANRADDRAFRLLQPEHRQPMALGLVGKAFLAGIRWPKADPSPIEDIRRDGRGNYYVQIKEAQFRLVDKRVKEKRNAELTLKLPDLGNTLVKDPQKCERAGMIPAALTRIHQDWDLEQIADEVWAQNQTRWQLPHAESRSEHLIVERRLSRRDPGSEDASARIPSQTIKVWLSRDLADKLEEDGRALRFDYQIKEVRHFEDSPGRPSTARAQ